MSTPTYSRFFTFASNFNKFLTLVLLGIQEQVLQVPSVVPRPENKARLAKVLSFTRLPGALDYLKRTSLVLELTTHVHSICAQDDAASAPPLVRLAQGRVRLATVAALERQAAHLRLDPALDVSVALTLLLSVSADTIVRFRQASRVVAS